MEKRRDCKSIDTEQSLLCDNSGTCNMFNAETAVAEGDSSDAASRMLGAIKCL